MKSIGIVFLSLCCFLGSLTAQLKTELSYDSLLIYLDRSVQTGHKRSLRDLGSLLGRKDLAKNVQAILQNRTLFTPAEFVWKKKTAKQDFLDFYYNAEQQLLFSELYDAFFITDPERWELKFELTKLPTAVNKDAATVFRQYAQELNQVIAKKQQQKAIKLLQQIGALRLKEAQQYMVELCQQTNWLKAAPEFTKQLVEQLQDFPRIETVDQVLALYQAKLISGSLANQVLQRLTNLSVSNDGNYAELGQRYRFYLDSLGTLDDLRLFGYKKTLNLSPILFDQPVDFYGRILSKCPLDKYSWVRQNAILDIVQTENPKALFYIAAQVYKFRQQDSEQQAYFISLIQALTQLSLAVPNAKGKLSDTPISADLRAQFNYANYWAKHYDDYNWEESRGLFINKKEAIEKTENYERLFRRLNSRNDTIAMASYQQLTEGDPASIIELTAKYRQLLRNYNKKLPNFKYLYLEELVKLTKYCRENQINYRVPKRLEKLLTQLLQKQRPAQRYRLENQIIKTMKLKEITAVEYWACLHAKNKESDFSMGRIFDWFYSQHWQKVIEDEIQFRLFLKKSYLFENIGVIGTGSAYLNKIDITSSFVQEKLSYLLSIESDEAIANQIARLISQSDETGSPSIGLDDFLADPSAYNKRDLKILAAPQKKDFKAIIQSIKNEFDPNNIKKVFSYLRIHGVPEMIPYLFELKDDQRVLSRKRGKDVKVVDFMISVVENIYSYAFPVDDPTQVFATEKWIALWEKEGKNYETWQKKFFEEKIIAFKEQSELSIDDINSITSSPHYNPSYKKLCLQALQKVASVKTIRQLNISPKLSLAEDLVYFEGFEFNYKTLDDIPKLFEIEQQEDLLLAFLQKKAVKYTVEDRGSFFNELFLSPWLANYINRIEKPNDFTQYLTQVLTAYLNESDYLSEFEEQNTMLHLAQLGNIGKSLEEKLQASINMDADEAAKQKIQQEIIATIPYEQIGTVFKFIDQLSLPRNSSPYNFLNKDFGLPIFNLQEYTEEKKLISNHSKMSEKAFYAHYITAFGVDFLTPKEKLDYQKIYEILNYDVTTPFIGSSGGKRDYYIFGIIKLLEIEFNDRLGFHQKLNHAQTFYSYSSIKRAEAWKQYLLDHNLVKKDTRFPPSFNQVKTEEY
ncbi:MAG: hypothetical protein AB8G15_05670 [Saprospiraceae bacterium]